MLLANLTRPRAGRAGRRDLLQRHLPLGPRPRPAVSSACTRRCGPAGGSRLSAAGGQRGRVRAGDRRAQRRRALRALPARDRAARGSSPGSGRRRCGSQRAGFEAVRLWLERKRYQPREPRAYLRASGLAFHLDRLPEDLHEPFVDAVLGSMPRPLVLDYVRLNISARRPRRRLTPARISPCCPATGSARRSWRLRAGCWRRSASSSFDGAGWSAAPRSTPTATALTDEVLEACRRSDAVLLGRRRRAEVGHDGPRRPAARAGPARPAQGPRPLREPAPGASQPRAASAPARCARIGSPAPTCWWSGS